MPLPRIHPNFICKSHRWKMDVDYADKLSEEEQKWLKTFLDEYYNGKFDKSPRKRLTRKKKDRRAIERDRNAGRRDMGNVLIGPEFNLVKYKNDRVVPCHPLEDTCLNHQENLMIEAMDKEKEDKYAKLQKKLQSTALQLVFDPDRGYMLQEVRVNPRSKLTKKISVWTTHQGICAQASRILFDFVRNEL